MVARIDDSISEVEITPEMIEAGAAALARDPWVDVGSGYVLKLARDVLEAAMLARARENSSVG